MGFVPSGPVRIPEKTVGPEDTLWYLQRSMDDWVFDNPQLLATIRKNIERTQARGEDVSLDKVTKSACIDCYGINYTPDQLEQAASFFWALRPKGMVL